MAINKSFKGKTVLGIAIASFVGCGLLTSCCSNLISTDDGGNYFAYIEEFHDANFLQNIDAIQNNNLSLYVDYSTCNVLGQNSAFYQALVPSCVAAAKNYYSIKGDSIIKEKRFIIAFFNLHNHYHGFYLRQRFLVD